MLDAGGLITKARGKLTPVVEPFAKPASGDERDGESLLEVVKRVLFVLTDGLSTPCVRRAAKSLYLERSMCPVTIPSTQACALERECCWLDSSKLMMDFTWRGYSSPANSLVSLCEAL